MKKEDLQVIVDFICDQRENLKDFIKDPALHLDEVEAFEEDIKSCDAFLTEAKKLGLKTE